MISAEERIAELLDVYIDDASTTSGPTSNTTIAEGRRDSTLTSMAGLMRKRGFSVSAIAAALRVENQQKCRPPLPDRDIERIAQSVGRYQAGDMPSPSVALSIDIFQTAAQITEEQPPAPRWIVPGYLAPGVITEIDGKLKVAGKTTFIGHMVQAIRRSRSFIGRPTRSTAVVWLTEERATSFQETLKRAHLEHDTDIHVLYWHKVKGAPWSDVMNLAIANPAPRA